MGQFSSTHTGGYSYSGHFRNSVPPRIVAVEYADVRRFYLLHKSSLLNLY